MVGGTFGITGQKQYRNGLGQVPGYDKFAEDKKESSEEMFSFTSCAFFLLPEMMRRFILTLEILFVSLFLLGGSFPETETARNTSGGFSWKDYRTIAHALGGMDGKDYLNSREGFLFMYEQGVRLFELDLSRTSDGVWVCRHNWNDSMGQWDGNGKKSPYRKGIQTK